jgi:hypothetical protein
LVTPSAGETTSSSRKPSLKSANPWKRPSSDEEHLCWIERIENHSSRQCDKRGMDLLKVRFVPSI